MSMVMGMFFVMILAALGLWRWRKVWRKTKHAIEFGLQVQLLADSHPFMG